MKFRVRKISWDPRIGKLEGLAIELELALPRMKSSDPSGENRFLPAELLDVVDALPELVATFDRDGHLLFVNESGRRLLDWESGQTRDDVILSDLYSEPDAERLLHEALSAATRQGSWSGRVDILTRKGTSVGVEQHLISHPPEETKVRAFTIVARPIESRQSGKSDETRDLDALVTLSLSLGFVHDLNNLLFPISAYASLVERHVVDPGPRKRYLGQIQRAARRAQELSTRLLDRLRARPFESRLVVLSDVVREAIGFLAGEFPQHHLALQSPLPPGYLLGDPVALEEVVTNLCRNALESLPADGGSVAVGLAELAGERTLRLTVSDNGGGITEEDLKRVFEPFFTTKARGTGLGLAVTRELVRLHGGTITVETLPGRGTTIRVELPIGDIHPNGDPPKT
jgi:signal transduction histidine kinase